MNEVVGKLNGNNIGATFFRGSKPMYEVWATPDLVVVGSCVMLSGYVVDDYRLFILDFLASSLIGKIPPRIIQSGERLLNTKIPSTKDNYTNFL